MFTKRFLLGAVVASLVIAAMGAGTASASRVSVESGTLVYTAEPGEANDLFIYPAQIPGYTGVYDDGGSVTTGSGCTVAPEVFVGIPPFADLYYICSGVTNGITVDLGDGNDFAGMEVGGGVTVHAGAGNDDVYSIDGDDVLDGGPGDDNLEGGPGKDMLTGGEGNDTLEGRRGLPRIRDRRRRRGCPRRRRR
jgi:Ca2+-binding RTX toxin-like protein